jgi:hypothetical protein
MSVMVTAGIEPSESVEVPEEQVKAFVVQDDDVRIVDACLS